VSASADIIATDHSARTRANTVYHTYIHTHIHTYTHTHTYIHIEKEQTREKNLR